MVTGIGAVSPNGIGREAFWAATLRGQSGVRLIERFDVTGMTVRIAGQVENFNELAYVSVKDRPHVSRAAPFAIAAAGEALADSGLDPSTTTPISRN